MVSLPERMEQRTVLVVIDDLFFLSKVHTTLQHLGLAATVITAPAALQAYLQHTTPALAVVDLTLRTGDAVYLISTIRATHGGQQCPILAFGSHVAVDLRQQALQAGAAHVVAKSEFARHLPDLIQQHVTQT
ncbi:MAG TPA: response regulator [Candidatus Tectomicrobia bacterium]